MSKAFQTARRGRTVGRIGAIGFLGVATVGLLALLGGAASGPAGAAGLMPPLPVPSPQRNSAAAVPSRSQAVAEAKPTANAGGATGSAPASSPKPAPPRTSEQVFQDDVAKMVMPASSFALPKPEADAVVAALNHLNSGKLDEARAIQGKVSHPAARKLIDWHALRIGFGEAADFIAFLSANPGWPDASVLQRRLEQVLFLKGGSANEILATLEKFKPENSVGVAAQASAHLALGNTAKVRRLAAQAWCITDLPRSFEDDFLRRFGQFLNADAHKCRLEKLLVAHIRGRGGRAARAARIRPVIALLPEAERAKYTARLSLFLRQSAAPSYLAKVPEAARKGDAGLAFQRANYLRVKGHDKEAWAMLQSIAADAPGLVNRDTWWDERHVNALAALEAGKTKIAYALVDRARPETVNPAKEQAFFAGFVALTHLRDAKRALPHFERMRKLADGPLSLSTAHFWLGMTTRKLGRAKAARAHFSDAARIRDTFHGLLAREELGAAEGGLDLPMPVKPTPEEAAALVGSDVVQAMVLTLKLDLDRRRYALRFYRELTGRLKSEGEFVALAQIARNLRDGQLEVRAGKSGIARGHNLYIYAYPLDYLPAFTPLRPTAERALLLGIARQESEFNTEIVSRAGARGVLQVMPVTARHVCRDYKIQCRIRDLLADPVYNARIAAAYIADRMDDFGGSYILTLTGYNAGPGRTRQWLRAFGDPRSRTVDALDWIYRIPFDETRQYVQKVLSNVQVYRARLGEKMPLRLRNDMRRAEAR